MILGCRIVDYQLTCNEDYYAYDGLIIDLQNDGSSQSTDNIILTKDNVIFQNRIYSYEQLLDTFHHNSNLNVNDVENFISSAAIMFYLILFIITFIGGTIYFVLANIILAAVMMWLINGTLKVRYKYDQMFKLTLYVVTPYVAFNGIFRILINGSIAGAISSHIPFLGFFVHIIIDYTVIYLLTYLAVKAGKKIKAQESDFEPIVVANE